MHFVSQPDKVRLPEGKSYSRSPMQ
jgi:hypothetical protein